MYTRIPSHKLQKKKNEEPIYKARRASTLLCNLQIEKKGCAEIVFAASLLFHCIFFLTFILGMHKRKELHDLSSVLAVY